MALHPAKAPASDFLVFACTSGSSPPVAPVGCPRPAPSQCVFPVWIQFGSLLPVDRLTPKGGAHVVTVSCTLQIQGLPVQWVAGREEALEVSVG